MQSSAALGALLLLLGAAAQMPKFGAQATLITGTVELGGSCYYDEECDTTTTFCRDRRLCDCKERFREAEGRCVATVGARCTSVYDCSSLEYAECSEAKECVCREGYVRHSSYYSCLPVVTVYQGACEEDTQCQMSFGEYAVCQNDMCGCLDSRHWADGKCWQSVGLGSVCYNTTQCSYDQNERNRVHCLDGTCQCREGWRQSDRVCLDGAAQITLSLAAIFFVAARFLIS